LLFGVLLGPHVLSFFGEHRPIADFFAELGKLLLMFSAGLEIDLALFPPGRAEIGSKIAATEKESAHALITKGDRTGRGPALHWSGSNGCLSGHQFRLRLMHYLRTAPELAGQNQSDSAGGDSANHAGSPNHQ
jgi:hypothetical protein